MILKSNYSQTTCFSTLSSPDNITKDKVSLHFYYVCIWFMIIFYSFISEGRTLASGRTGTNLTVEKGAYLGDRVIVPGTGIGV